MVVHGVDPAEENVKSWKSDDAWDAYFPQLSDSRETALNFVAPEPSLSVWDMKHLCQIHFKQNIRKSFFFFFFSPHELF